MEDKRIQLTEQDIHFLVEDAVRNYLRENQTDELFGGLKAMMGGYGSRMQQDFRNAKNLYRAGSINTNVQKAVRNVMNALNNLQRVAKGVDPYLESLVTSIETELQQGVQQSAQTNLQNAKNNFVNRQYGNQRNNQNPTFTVQQGDGNGGFTQY